MPVRAKIYVVPPTHAAFKVDVTKDRQGTIAFSGGLNTDKQPGNERYLSRPEKLPNGKYRYWYLFPFKYTYRTPSGATIPARISLSAAICGAARAVLPITDFDSSIMTKL
jgi:hypothetical protein